MSDQPDLILIVDDDPAIRALLREQVLTARSYRVIEAKDAPDAMLMLHQRPDLIVLDLQLPGLSGKDLLIGVQSQGYRGPLVAMAEGSSPRGVIEAFRLGATDYVTKPLREAEVLAAVERGLADVRLRRQRDALIAQLQGANRQLEARVKELTTLFDIGQSVTALSDLDGVFNNVLDGAIVLTGADHSMLILRDDKSGQMILRAGRRLPLAMLDRLGESVQDQLADLVMTSRETLMITGDGLRRFSSARGLYAVAYVPLNVQKTSIGVLAIGNHQTQQPFTEHHGRLLRALADHAAIAIISVRLSVMLEQRSTQMQNVYRELQQRDSQRNRQLQDVLQRLHQPLVAVEADLIRLAQDKNAPGPNTRQLLGSIGQQVRQVITQIAALMQKQGR